MSIFEQTTIERIKGFTSKGELIGLPLYLNVLNLYYNKDVFDLFGVDYPRDGMTTDEIIELASRVTGTRDGVEYKGLSIPGGHINLSFGLDRIDPQTNEALFTKEPYRSSYTELYTFLKGVYDIPGNTLVNVNQFFEERTTAMFYFWHSLMVLNANTSFEQGNPMNWNMATLPTFANASQAGSVLDSHFFQLATTSAHPNEAFQVIQYLTSNQTIQADLAASGKVPAVLDQQVVQRYGANLNSLPDDLNWSILFESDFKQARTPHLLENMLNQPMGQAMNKIIRDGMDVNQAINELQEAATQIIRDNSHLLE